MVRLKALRPFKNSNYQYHLFWLFKALIGENIGENKNIFIPWIFRLIIAKIKIQYTIPWLCSKNDKLIVLGSGYIDSFVFPYAYRRRIVPILWDTWPKYWDNIENSFIRLKIKTAFFTQKQVAEEMNRRLSTRGVKCFHITEGIDISLYKKGKDLVNRNIDILELGRLYEKFNKNLIDSHYYKNIIHNYKDPKEGLLFETFEDLVNGICDSKIVICFPRSLTHPEESRGIETLTQRYWECMLSRSLIVGKAPADLIEFMGYNPVVEVDFDNVGIQMNDLLNNISSYQKLVDRNYVFALNNASWEIRAKYIKKILLEE